MTKKIKHVKYNGGVAGLVKRVKTPGTVDVGIIDAGMHDEAEDLTVAEIGYINEYGTDDGRIPERSYFRSTLREKKTEIIALQKKLLKRIQAGTITTEKALAVVGQFVASLVRQKIIDLKTPENAPYTIAMKGTSNPLVATKQLANSITYEVNK